MDRLLLLLSLTSALTFLLVLRSVRRTHIRVEHSVGWLAASASVFALSLAPGLLASLSAALGLPGPATVLLLLLGLLFLALLYRFSRAVSALKDMNITLTQRIAILEFRLRNQHEDPSSHS